MPRRTILVSLMSALTAGALAGERPPLPPIVLAQDYEAARASSWDRSGANRDFVSLPAGEAVELATLAGPGVITHIWLTIGTDHPTYLSDLVLRVYWDGVATPAVDSPIGPFFGLGHDRCADVVSAPIAVMKGRANYIEDPPGRAAFNTYFPMPFRKNARIEVVNRGPEEVPSFFFHIDYQQHRELPESVRYFHARYRSERTRPAEEPEGKNVTEAANYVVLDTRGEGHYVGCTLHVEAHQEDPGEWYEGDETILVDGQALEEAIHGTGTEDYFNMAWGVRRWFQSAYFGTSFHAWNPGEPELESFGRFSVYRFHLLDPVPFAKAIRVTVEHGHNNDAGSRYASVAYWYAAAP
jgi:hypothetical protein